MASTLEELEQSFGGASAVPTAEVGSLEELERSYATGADAIPRDKNTVPSVEKPAAPEFDPGFMGGVEKALAQIGAGIDSGGMGIRQLMGKATEADVDEKRRIDAQLLGDSTMGKANYLLGKVAPSLAIPASVSSRPFAPIVYNGVIGGLQGLTEPVGTGDSRGLNVIAGTMGGAAAPAVVKLLGSVLKPAADATGELARKAMDMGIPLGARDISASRFTKALSSLLDDLPITGPVGQKHSDDVATAITRNVGKTAGIESDVLDQATVAAQKKVLGKQFDKMWDNTQVEMDANLFGAIQMANGRLDELAPETATTVRKQLQTMMAKVIEDPKTGKLYLPGNLVNDIQQKLGAVAGTGKGVERDVAGGLQREVLDAFGRSTPPGSREELVKLKSQWKSLTKVIAPLVGSAEAGVAGREAGQIPIAPLPQQAKVAYGDNLHTSPYADLAPIAGRFGVNRASQTGGGMRALLQGAVAPAALGTGAYMLGAGTPLSALAGATALTGTAGVAAQKMLTSPAVARRAAAAPVRRALLGAPSLRPALRELTGTALSRGSATGALGLAATAGRAAEPTSLEEE